MRLDRGACSISQRATLLLLRPGLATFEIPTTFLQLLGLSQFVFVGGKAIEKSSFPDLDQKIASIRDHERKYQAARAALASNPHGNEAAKTIGAELDAFKREAREAAEIFWPLYCDTLKRKPDALGRIDTILPETSFAR